MPITEALLKPLWISIEVNTESVLMNTAAAKTPKSTPYIFCTVSPCMRPNKAAESAAAGTLLRYFKRAGI